MKVVASMKNSVNLLKNHGKLRKRLKKFIPWKLKMKRIKNKNLDSTQCNQIHGFKSGPNFESYAHGVKDPRPKGVLGGWYPHIYHEGGWRAVMISDNWDCSMSSPPPTPPRYLFYFKITREKGKRRKLSRVILDIDKYLYPRGKEVKK